MQADALPATGIHPQLRPSGHRFLAHAETDASLLDQLLDELADRVADRVAARLAVPQSGRPDEWFDSRKAAEYLGVGRDSVRRLAAEGRLPVEQAGTNCKLFFRRSDLDRWRCTASGPIESERSLRHG